MSALRGRLYIRDLRDDSLVTDTHLVTLAQYSSETSKAGTHSFTIIYGDDAAPAFVAAVGGTDMSGTPLPYQVEFSLGDGDVIDYRFMILNPEDGLSVGHTGNSLWTGYMVRGVDRVTFQDVPFSDAINGAPGTIISHSFGSAPSEFGAGIPLKDGKGILYTTPGLDTWAGQYRLKYTPQVHPNIGDVLVDSDDFAVLLPDALQALIAQVTGVVVPGDDVPLGARGYWVEDSGKRTIRIGYVGQTVKGTFAKAATVGDLSQAQIHEPAGQPLTRSAHLDEIVSIYSPAGGTTNHGLPEAANISAPVLLNTDRGRDSIDWDANLLLFCAVDSGGNGGVYYWAHDGNAYPVGQGLPGACSLCYFAPTNTLYVASFSGVYSRPATIDSTLWTRLGGLSATVTRIVIDQRQGGGIGVNVVAEVKGAGSGGDGLYIFQGLDDNGGDYGYAGWSVLSQNAPSAWNYCYPGDTLLTADPNDPSAVLALFSATDTLLDEAPTSRFLTPNGANVTAIFTIPNGPDPAKQPGGNCVLTAEGALGMYLFDLLGNVTNLNADYSLVDPAGNPPTVSKVSHFGGPVVVEGVDLWVELVAWTASGPYVSPYRTGGSWKAMGIQSGVANIDMTDGCIGTPQTVVDRVITRFYGVSGQGLFVSHSGGKYWDNETSDLLSIGGYLTDLGALLGQVPHLANDITSIGDIPDDGTVGTSGTNLPGPVDGPFKLPGDLCWTRPLDERNKWVYKLVHTLTSNPYVSTRFGEIAELATNASTDAKTASGRLALEMTRGMVVWATPQLNLTIISSFSDTAHFLRTLRAGDLVHVSYDSTAFYGILLDNTPMYVLSHQIAKGQGDTVAYTTTQLGTQYRMTEITDAEITHGINYEVSRQARYGKS